MLGTILLSEWVSRPTQDKDVLDYRHESIRFFLQPNMREVTKEFSDNLKHIKNIHRLLSKVKESKTKSNDWQHILKVSCKMFNNTILSDIVFYFKFAYYTIRTFGLVNQLHHHGSNNVSFIKKAMHFLPAAEVMNAVGSDINSIVCMPKSKFVCMLTLIIQINFEMSKQEGRIIVKDNVDGVSIVYTIYMIAYHHLNRLYY